MRNYRGKRLDNGEWVHGHLISGEYVIDERKITAIVTQDTQIFPHCEVAYEEVDPATVGQYTGIYTMDEIGGGDTRCTFIYAGDIVEPVLTVGTHQGFSWGPRLVVFSRGAFCLKDRRGELTPMCNYAVNVKFKVLGNIHDNPELMEGQADA